MRPRYNTHVERAGFRVTGNNQEAQIRSLGTAPISQSSDGRLVKQSGNCSVSTAADFVGCMLSIDDRNGAHPSKHKYPPSFLGCGISCELPFIGVARP